jgi:integrase
MKYQKALDESNSHLNDGNIGFVIEIKNNALCLRGLLPPKNGTGDLKTQRIYLGYPPLAEGIRQAEKDALSVRVQLIEKRFNWLDWSPKLKKAFENPPDNTIAALVERFEKDYFNRKVRNPKSETTWDKDYKAVFKHLPQDKQFSPEVIMAAIAKTTPETRTRSRYAQALRLLAKFAGIDIDLSEYGKGYSPSKVNIRDLPTDEQIELYHSLIPTKSWQNAYALIATYGLRPHELVHLDLSELPTVKVLHPTKTGCRNIHPLHPYWVSKFAITENMELPAITAKKNCEIGSRVGHQFERYAIAFPPYNLRHAYAVRCSIVYQFPVAIAAKMMGHSANVHQAVYLKHLTDESVIDVYSKKIEEFKT